MAELNGAARCRCRHGAVCTLTPIGDGWVQPVATGCVLCKADPGNDPVPFKLENPAVPAPPPPTKPRLDAEKILPGLIATICEAEGAIFEKTKRGDAVRRALAADENWIRVALPPEGQVRVDKIAEFTAALGGPPSEVSTDAAVWRTPAEKKTMKIEFDSKGAT